jgi:uncharacterized protein (DUF885 family)
MGVAAAVVLGLWAGARGQQSEPATGGSAPSAADLRVVELLAEDYEAQKRFDPLFASGVGDRRFDDLLPDLSAQAREAWLADAAARLAAIDAIEAQGLSAPNAVNAALLRYELRLRLDGARFNGWQIAVTPLSGPQQSLPQLPDNLSFTTRESLEDYAARLEAVPAYLAQVMENMRAGLAAGNTPPSVVMGNVAAQALAQGDARFESDPEAHAIFRPFAGAAPDLAERGRKAIQTSVAPAFRLFGEFLRDEYVPGCRQTLAAKELPGGMEFYNFQVRRMTTTQLTADQIHQIGNREVARIRDEMLEVIARSDFAGKDEPDENARFAAFVQYLRTDKRFYFDDPEKLLSAYRDIAKRVDADLPRLFGRLPQLSYGVREMPRFMAPSSPTAYYYPGSMKNGVAGFFVANTYRLDQRPKYEMVPLTLHEACPGHHLQTALAQELNEQGLPEWRTTADYTAFVEGWALYSERLGFEMGDMPRTGSAASGYSGGRGMYEDPYDDFGRLSYEMWRAMRLVVDTGIHAMGWSRERAVQFMLANSALTEENINREVDRYIAWPGQALAYKIGELRIRDLRAEAEGALGDRFDVRAFHDVVLGQGAVPLEVLAAQVKRWVEETKKEARAALEEPAELVSAVYFEGARPRQAKTGWLQAIWADGMCVFLADWDGKEPGGELRVGTISPKELAELKGMYDRHQVFAGDGDLITVLDSSAYFVCCFCGELRVSYGDCPPNSGPTSASTTGGIPFCQEAMPFLQRIKPRESTALASDPEATARWEALKKRSH